MAVMRRLLVIAALATGFAGANAAPASADLLSDLTALGVGAEELLSFETSIGLPRAPGLGPIDMTTKWMPVGEPLTKPSSASKAAAKKKRKKSRRARR